MKITGKTWLAAALSIAVSASISFSAQAAGDAAKGEKVFRKCKACHSLEAGKKKMGPTLAGIMGRQAGSVEGFRYSKAMKAADIVWNSETVAAFLAAPRKYVKGTKMAFAGLRKPADIENLLAYLEANTK
jgi:cytochrome c